MSFVERFNQRFARPALNPHDAHRPLLDGDVFTWKEKRKVSKSLTLHYKRVMYLLEDTPDARAAMGCQVDIVEDQDGEVQIHHKGRELRARGFDKEGHVTQAAIVENKLLSGALRYAREMQEQRDAKKLSARSTTKRDTRLLRAKQCKARLGDGFDAAHAPL